MISSPITRPMDSGAWRCGQRSSSATSAPVLEVWNRTIGRLHTTRPIGRLEISEARATQYQMFSKNMFAILSPGPARQSLS